MQRYTKRRAPQKFAAEKGENTDEKRENYPTGVHIASEIHILGEFTPDIFP